MYNQQVLEKLQGGLEVYLRDIERGFFNGMCGAILCYVSNHTPAHASIDNILYCMKDFRHSCPEFDPTFLNSDYPDGFYWWDLRNTEARINAFNTLIELYTKKVQEEQK